MHGRLKLKTSAEKEAEKRKERSERAKFYHKAITRVFEKRKNGEFDDESYAITGQILALNPDFTTLWNYRREIILSKKNNLMNDDCMQVVNDQQSTDNEVNENCKEENRSDLLKKLYETEFTLTANCLMKNLKSYCVWHHRMWVIELMENPNYQMEIALCNQLLEIDERTFICWDYRRFICNLANTDLKEELEFTLKKIKQNFSNFSSWYYRSCLFTLAANKYNYDFSKEWQTEYDLVENALFTDPSDQSAWFYHKWLVSTNYGKNLKHVTNDFYVNTIRINRIVYNPSHSTIIMNLSRPIKSIPLIMLSMNDVFMSDITWKCPENSHVSSVWYCNIGDTFTDSKLSTISITPCPTFAINPEYIEPDVFAADNCDNGGVIIWEKKIDYSKSELTLQESCLQSLRTLNQIEPNNKWVRLSLAWLDSNYLKSKETFDEQIKIDPLRVNYYNDLRSKLELKNHIETAQTTNLLSYNQLNLTSLYFADQLTHIVWLDLSRNQFKKLTKIFNYLLSLEVLIMDFNQIHSIDKGFCLNKLKILSLNNNNFKRMDSLANLKRLTSLEKLIIKRNPISNTLNESLLLNSQQNNVVITDDDYKTEEDIENLKDLYKQLDVIYNLY